MLTSLILAGCLLQGQVLTKEVTLPMAEGSSSQLVLREFVDPITPAAKSPKKFGASQVQRWFDWCIQGLVITPEVVRKPVFAVYSQERQASGDKLEPVSRMLMRLWDLNYKRIRVMHDPNYNDGMIEAYLCVGGKPGGEQIFGEDPTRRARGSTANLKVNSIYFYDLDSFTNPIEMAREVAHEYGHATLPSVAGYNEPESWANGYMGEKLYLRWMRDAMAKGELGTFDTMGATKEDLDKWVAENVDPVIEKSAQILPTDVVMGDKSKAGMDEFIGLALYIETLYSDKVFLNSLKFVSPAFDPQGYPDAAVTAAEELPQIKLNIPSYLEGKLIWIPLGTGKVSGTTIVKKGSNGWAQIKAGSGPVFVYNSH